MVGVAMGWAVEVSVEEETSRFLTAWQPGQLHLFRSCAGCHAIGAAPAAMRLCLLRRVNASSATHLSLPLVGMEVLEPVMEVSLARICIERV